MCIPERSHENVLSLLFKRLFILVFKGKINKEMNGLTYAKADGVQLGRKPAVNGQPTERNCSHTCYVYKL